MNEFDYARDALRYIIRENDITEIYIPYYLCDVIRHAIVAEGAKPLFYHIDDNFMPNQSFPKESYLLYPNYFGICDNNVDKLAEIYPKLIVDNAHAFYAKPKGFATIYSPHKFKNSNPDRREIFDKIHEKLADRNQLNIGMPENAIPFCYPFLAKNLEEADDLVKILQNKGLAIYRYWNPLPKSYNEYKFYSRLVPIPLDDYVLTPNLQ